MTPFRPWSILTVASLALLGFGLVRPVGVRGQAQAGGGRSEVRLVIGGDAGAPPSYAVPDFLPLSPDPELAELATQVADVLWNDLAYEREFDLIGRDTYSSVPAVTSPLDLPFQAWRELGADGLVFGTIVRDADTVRLQVRLYNVRDQQSVFAREYSTTRPDARALAHTIADEIHQDQRALRGVARTKLVFSSDRDGDRAVGNVEPRDIKEIYYMDYDGRNQQRVTINRNLNVFPVWTPDRRAILYTSYIRGYPDLFLGRIYEGIRDEPTKDHGTDEFGFRTQNALGVVSPDGTRICFASNRDGNYEIYVMDLDGSNLFRLTNHEADDITPTWNPQGTQIAFTSNRRGRPQIYLIGADGTNLTPLTYESYADRAAWSPLGTEIAYHAQTGPGFDIKVIDLSTREVRQLTFGIGTNESPSFAPNGRHLAFMSTRAGRAQIFTIDRDGRNLRQLTRTGNNYTPNWSQ